MPDFLQKTTIFKNRKNLLHASISLLYLEKYFINQNTNTLSEKRKVFLIKTFFFFPKYLHCNISLGSVFLRIPIESIKNQICLKK